MGFPVCGCGTSGSSQLLVVRSGIGIVCSRCKPFLRLIVAETMMAGLVHYSHWEVQNRLVGGAIDRIVSDWSRYL